MCTGSIRKHCGSGVTTITELSIAICDDLREERSTLIRMVQNYCRQKGISLHMYPFSSGEELLSAMHRPERFHVIFLDIYMPGLTGIETARRIRQSDSSVAIILATTSLDHGIEGFEVDASDYLVKPIQEEDVARSLDWCLEHPSALLQVVSVYSEGEWIDIPLSSISYIEVLDHQSHIHTDQKKTIVTRRGIDDLSGSIGSEDFLRCHRSYLVNMNHVQSIEGADFRVTGGELVPISMRDLAKHRSQFIDWTYKKAWSHK